MHPTRFAHGFSAPFSAIGFWLRRPSLWAFGLWPVLINLALTTGVGYAGYRWAFVPLMAKLGHGEGFWNSLWKLAAGIGIGIVLLVAGVFLFVLLATILGAPFYDLMGERIEKEAFAARRDLRATEAGLWQGVRYSLAEALRRLAVVIPLALLGLLLGFVPLIGPALGGAVGVFATWLFLVLDAWSYALDRRRVPVKSKIEYIRKHFTIALGLGIGLFVLYLIPCAWFFAPPLAAIAGTRLFCGLELDSPLSDSQAPSPTA